MNYTQRYDRLLKIVDFHKALPDANFDFSTVVSKHENGCGTVCCVIGNLPKIFPNDFKYNLINGRYIEVAGAKTGRDWISASPNFLGLYNDTTVHHEDAHAYLFQGSRFEKRNLFGKIKKLLTTASREEVVMHIEEYIYQCCYREFQHTLRKFDTPLLKIWAAELHHGKKTKTDAYVEFKFNSDTFCAEVAAFDVLGALAVAREMTVIDLKNLGAEQFPEFRWMNEADSPNMQMNGEMCCATILNDHFKMKFSTFRRIILGEIKRRGHAG